jgi:hypothetical protein
MGSACGIRTRDLRLERAASWAARRTRQRVHGAERVGSRYGRPTRSIPDLKAPSHSPISHNEGPGWSIPAGAFNVLLLG